ncbi:MAG: flippase-like domain-containing protein [Xanthomonadaceae bacterium]|nr:flippase-like domain-containing protein [Xanthomonadaceae bacterium]
MSRWIRHLGLLLGLAATAAFVAYAARTLRGQDLSRYLAPPAIGGIALAAVCYALIIPISALAWRLLLKDMGVARRWRELATIMGITQLAKYIPGNVGQHIGRAAMSLARGIPLRPYGISVVSEAVLAAIAAALVGIAGCGMSGPGMRLLPGHHGALALPALLVAACALALGLVLARRALPSLLRRFASKRHGGDAHGALPGNRILAAALLAYVLNYLVFGTGIAAMTLLLLPGQPAHWLLLTGGFALAWVVGFFAPGAPAGLGVREGLMLALLQFGYSPPDALLIVIAMRLATTAGDILCFLAGSAALFLSGRTIGARAAMRPIGDHHET